MTFNAPSARLVTHRRALATLLSLMTGLLLPGDTDVAGSTQADPGDTELRQHCDQTIDVYPIVTGSDEDTLLVCPDLAVAEGDAANGELANRLYDGVFNAEDPDVAAALIADDAVIETAYTTYQGPDGLLEYVAFVKRAYPDANFEVTGVANKANTLEISWTMTATQIVVDPVEQPLKARVEITGMTTVTLGQAEVTSLVVTNGTQLIEVPLTDTT